MKSSSIRFLLFVLSIAAAGGLAQQFFPWYSMVVAAALLGFLFRQGVLLSFAAGFLAVFLLWGGYALILNSANDGLLAARFGQLFGGVSAGLLVIITGLLGGVFGGLGAVTGSLVPGGRAGGR